MERGVANWPGGKWTNPPRVWAEYPLTSLVMFIRNGQQHLPQLQTKMASSWMGSKCTDSLQWVSSLGFQMC